MQGTLIAILEAFVFNFSPSERWQQLEVSDLDFVEVIFLPLFVVEMAKIKNLKHIINQDDLWEVCFYCQEFHLPFHSPVTIQRASVISALRYPFS